MSLFNLKTNEEAERGANLKGAKVAVPKEGSGIVNVVRDYQWTLAPKSARKDVPYLYMIERRVTNNVLLQQLLYNISVFATEGGNLPNSVIDAFRDKIEADRASAQEDGNEISDAEANAQLESAKNNARKKIIQKAKINNENPQSPYAGLYDLEDTGWQFVMPYFTDSNHSIRNAWGEPSEKGFGKFAEVAQEVTDNAAAGLNQIYAALGAATDSDQMRRVGTYVERAKQYKFEGNGPTYSVQFELFNTQSVEDIIRNWEICFLLIYNTLPNRRSKTTFDPPPLYEIEIPGIRVSPATFINSLKVEFLGNTRLMDLDLSGSIGASANKFRTIVPDAYQVTINFEDVFPETKNFMNSMVDPDVNISVEFDTVEGRDEYSLDEDIQTKYNDITYISLKEQQTGSQSGQAKNTQDGYANSSISKALNNVKNTANTVTKDIANTAKGVF